MNTLVVISFAFVSELCSIFNAVLLPSMPQNFQCTASATAINCNWSQPPTDVLTHYLLKWTYTGPCDSNSQSLLLNSSARNYLIKELEEGGNYVITLYTQNVVGSEGHNAMYHISTTTTGNYTKFSQIDGKITIQMK